MEDNPIERTSEPRSITDRYYSVEFSIKGSAYVYQFKIWDISPKGTYVLVKEDSDLLNHLKVGEILDLKYYTTDSSKPIECLETEIRHIAKDEKGRFKGLYLIGLSILEDQNSNQQNKGGSIVSGRRDSPYGIGPKRPRNQFEIPSSPEWIAYQGRD